MIPDIAAEKFSLRIRATTDLSLPGYKGSTLRGGFGHALREVACALKRQECETCLLRERCVYLYLFETPPPRDAEMMRLYPAAPHPFVIEPPSSNTRFIPEGDVLDFGLVLMGKALQYLPYFIYAFIRLGERGLGRERGRFHLEEVTIEAGDGVHSIYNSKDQVLREHPNTSLTSRMDRKCDQFRGKDEISLRFLTPTRIKSNGHLVSEPEFHHLVRSLLRRLSSLSYFHCDTRLDLDFRGLIGRAGRVERIQSDVRWLDWERYSSRRKEKMSLGGFIGEASYRGEVDEFLPFLFLGELLHVGKAASFGLGRYEMGVESPFSTREKRG